MKRDDPIFMQAELVCAADNNNIREVTALLEKGVTPNAEDEFGDTALGQALQRGNIAIVEMLLAAGADANRGIPLKLALTAGISGAMKEASVLALINAGADVNARDVEGVTPLLWAVAAKAGTVVQRLIDAGADVNAPIERDGDLPLLLAARNNLPGIADILLTAGADPEKKNKGGESAFSVAEAGTEMDSLLRSAFREKTEKAAHLQSSRMSRLKSLAPRIKPGPAP